MNAKKLSGANAWVDPDDAPELTEDFFDRAEIRQGNQLIRRGRPVAPPPKKQVTLRLDEDVLAGWRATGPGWQTRVNEEPRRINPNPMVAQEKEP